MEEINYALAPAGATHGYNGMWYMFKDDKWFDWVDGECKRITGLRPDDYEPIPEWEQVINKLADESDEWVVPNDGDYQHTVSIVITKKEWQERREVRISAGLIEVDNPIMSSMTNSQAMNMNNADMPVMPVLDRDGMPHVGVECEMAREGEMFHAGRILFKGEKLFVFKWSDNNQEIALRYHQVKFRPIKTAEQIAAEKRNKWAHSLCNVTSDRLPLEEAERIYDALLSGEVEVPEGAL